MSLLSASSAIAQLISDADLVHQIVTGPASGATSTVAVGGGGGTVKTISRVISEQTALVSAVSLTVQNAQTAASASATSASNSAIAAAAVAKMYPTTTAAQADGTLANASYFTTPSTVIGEAAIVYQKTSSSASVDTGIRIPSSALSNAYMPSESGYMWGVVGALQRMPLGVTTDGTVVMYKMSLPSGTIKKSFLDLNSYNVYDVINTAETGYTWAVVDGNRRVAIGVTADGTFIPAKIALPAGCVTPSSLANTIAIPGAIINDMGYAFAIVDSVGRVGFGVKIDGTLTGNFPGNIPNASLDWIKFNPLVTRQIKPTIADVVEARPSEWRATFGQIAVRTAADGTYWEPLPHTITQNIRTVNATGTSLDFRRSYGLRARGKRYAGTFNPGTVPSIRYTNQITASSTWPPTGTFTTGDYQSYIDPVSRVINGNTLIRGDIMVWDGAAWQYQASPLALSGGRVERDFWQISAAGTFDGVTYVIGDRILYLGFQSNSGTGWDRWYKSQAGTGELWYRGEFAPSGGLPASPVDGDMWQANAVGTAGGFTFAIGDMLIRETGTWIQVPTDPISSVANGAGIFLRCQDASEWEVRRTDKSGTRVGVFMNCSRGTAVRRNQDSLALWSDSMFGVSNVGGLILSKTGRNGGFQSYGGGTSRNVLTMLEYYFATQSDPYKGQVHVMWHGQNNQPGSGTDVNMAQIKEAALRMVDLIGARDARFLFMTILGTRNYSWNGSRIVISQYEDQKAKISPLWLLQDWYARTFPGQYISCYDSMIAAASASTLPDPFFPGMTEAQVASTYGIVPFSYSNGYSTLPMATTALSYKGTWSTVGLPTGGVANDYYIRIANGGPNLIINVAGTWTEFNGMDGVHLSPAGADALSTAVANFILNANW